MAMRSRIEREKQTISAMMRIYCRDHHATDQGLCKTCNELLMYAHRRLDICPFQEQKPTCNRCTVHCYSKTMRTQITTVMRYAGPKMLFSHPTLSLLHLWDKLRKVPTLKLEK